MAKTTQEKITDTEERIKQLENEKKQLIQKQKKQERADRTHRLCQRGGLVEKLLPDLIQLSDKQFETFVDKVRLTDFTARIVAELTAQNAEKPAEPRSEAEAPYNGGPTEKPVEPTAQAHNPSNSKPAGIVKPTGESTAPKHPATPQNVN